MNTIKAIFLDLVKVVNKIIPFKIKHPLVRLVFKKLVLLTKPVVAERGRKNFGLCTILCHKHTLIYILSIKSFFYFSKLKPQVFVVGDGSLTREDIALLKRHIRNITVLEGKRALKEILYKLRDYPYCYLYRSETYPELWTHNRKLFDPIFLSGFKKFILLDSDVVFFNTPKEIVEWAKSKNKKTYYMSYPKSYIQNEDRWGFLTVKVLSKIWRSRIAPFFNSGIICSYKDQVSLPLIEKYVKKIYLFSLERTWLSEQFTLSLQFSELERRGKRKIVKSLDSSKYLVLIDPSKRKPLWDKNCIHYHSLFKDTYLYYDALKLLVETKLFNKLR